MIIAKIIIDILIVIDALYGAKQFFGILLAMNSNDGGIPIRPKLIRLLIAVIILLLLIILRINLENIWVIL